MPRNRSMCLVEDDLSFLIDLEKEPENLHSFSEQNDSDESDYEIAPQPPREFPSDHDSEQSGSSDEERPQGSRRIPNTRNEKSSKPISVPKKNQFNASIGVSYEDAGKRKINKKGHRRNGSTSSSEEDAHPQGKVPQIPGIDSCPNGKSKVSIHSKKSKAPSSGKIERKPTEKSKDLPPALRVLERLKRGSGQADDKVEWEASPRRRPSAGFELLSAEVRLENSFCVHVSLAKLFTH